MIRIVNLVVIAALTVAAVPLGAANPGQAILLDAARSHGCTLTLADAGTSLLIRAGGLVPGESYRFTLTNGDMKPVDFAAYANGEGRLIQYYTPFRFGQPGGLVQIRLAAANCTLDVAAAWTRQVPVID